MTLNLEPLIEGNPDGPTLFFIHGWPDDASLWQSQVDALQAEYRCVRVTLPNFGTGTERRQGYSTEEIVDALGRCVRSVSPNTQVTLVLHDWGCFYGHLLHKQQGEIVGRIVTLDVAPHMERTPWLAAILAYQAWLAVAFRVGGPIGDRMTRFFARISHVPRPAEELSSDMNYPYRNSMRSLAKREAPYLFAGYWPDVPMLFIYGTKKPFMFHSQRWLDHVASVGGRVVALGSGHWVPKHPELNDILIEWLGEEY